MFKKILNYTTQNDGYQKNGKLNVKGLMLHSTATPGIMAQEFRDRFNKPGLGKSVHGFLDDCYYVQCLPYDKKAGHCRYSGNDTHIGIELCEPEKWQTDQIYFDKVYENAVELFAELCLMFGLNSRNIIDHAEGYQQGIASNHSDIGHWFPLFGKNMDTFRKDVEKRIMLNDGREENEAGNKEDIRKLQNALNANYGEKLEEDGILGSKTKSAVQAHWLSYRQGEEIEEGAYVLWVQERLLCKGYDVGGMGADAKYGKNTAAAVKRLQEDCGIQIDGIVGINTVIALLSSCHK